MANLNRLTTAEKEVDRALHLQAIMEHHLQQCLGHDTKARCWDQALNADFDPEAVPAAWQEFENAVVQAREDARTQAEFQRADALKAIPARYRDQVSSLFDAGQRQEAAARILGITRDLDKALDNFRDEVVKRRS